MAIYTEKQPKPVIAIIFLVLAFLMMFSLRQIGDRELYWNEGAHAVISQAISLEYPVSEIHGEASLDEYPLFHLLVSGLIKSGVPVEYALRMISIIALAGLTVLTGIAAYRQHGQVAGVVAAAVMMSCNIIMEKSLEGYPYNLTLLFLLSGWLIWFYFGAGSGSWNKAWFFAFLFCGLGFYTCGLKAVIFFILPLVFMRRPLTIWSKLRRKGLLFGLLALLFFVFIWLIPIYVLKIPIRPLDVDFSWGKYMEHLRDFPVGVVMRLLPWSIFIWAPFCVGLHPLDEHPIFSRFLRTIFFVLFFIIWLSPFSTPRDIAMLVPPAAILTGIYYWIVVRRYGGHIFNLLIPVNWCAIICGIIVLIFFLFPVSWWSFLFSLSRGVKFRTMSEYYWPGILRGAAISIVGIVLVTKCRRGTLPLWAHITTLSCLGMMFFWAVIHPYRAQENSTRQLGAKIKQVLAGKPDSGIVYKYNIIGLYGAMYYADCKVRKIRSLDQLPKDKSNLYIISAGTPQVMKLRLDWEPLLILDENVNKIFLWQGRKVHDSPQK